MSSTGCSEVTSSLIGQFRESGMTASATRVWPQGVKEITFEAIGMLGFHERTHELYWNGEKVVTVRRLATVERWLAALAVAAAVVGAGATVVQAWAAVMSIPH